MLTQTAELGIQIMLYLALHGGSEPVPPRRIAGPSGASPTYAAKVTSLLVKAGLLRAQRGAHGGVMLARGPADITLLEVVEACQGVILADYCQPHENLKQVCGYHHAMHDLHEALTGVLRRWTLADIAKRPCPHEALRGKVDCKLQWLEKVRAE
jgi:Rrf2 family protein